MGSKIFFFTLLPLLLLITTNIEPTKGDTTIKTTDFYDYIDIVKKLSTIADKLRILKAIWAEIRCDYESNLKAIESLHKTIYNLSNETATNAAQEQEIDEFDQEVRQVIITKNAQQLAQIMNIQMSPLDFEADTFVLKIIKHFDYDTKISNKIFENAIDQLYGLRDTLELAAFLNSYEIENRVNAILLHSQLYLYWKFIARHDINDSYLLYIAYYMYKVKPNVETHLPDDVVRRLNDAIKSIPSTSVQSLFFATKIYVINTNNTEYLYEFAGDGLDSTRKYIFTWRPGGGVGTNGPYTIQFTKSNTSISGILRNVLFEHYLYRDQRDNRVYAWLPTGPAPSNSLWSLSLNDNKLSFYQGDLYLCGADTRDPNRRYVQGIKQSAASVPSICEWYIGSA